MSQVAFLIVFLFTLGKRKSVSAFGASDLDVWHVAVLPRVRNGYCSTLLLTEPGANHPVLYPLACVRMRIPIIVQRLRSPEFRNGQVGLSLLQQEEWFNKIGGLTPGPFCFSLSFSSSFAAPN